MKKLSFLVAAMLLASLALAACGGTPAGASSSSVESQEEAFFDPSLLQVTALDDKTLEVKLTAATPYFLELTAFPTYSPLPMHIINEVGESWATQADTFIGNGPYRVTEYVSSSHIKMEKNPSYWDADNVGPKTIEFKLIEDSVAELNAFQTGEVSFIDNPPPDEIPSFQNEDYFHSEPQLGTYYLSINNQAEPFNDPLVRKAFALAIDRTHMAEVIGNNLYIPADAWVAPGLTDVATGSSFREEGGSWWDPAAAAYEANCDEARAALAEAGFPGGEGFPTVTYIYNDAGVHPAVAEALQNMWKAVLGVTVDLEIQEWAVFLNSRKNGEYQLARDGWLSDYNDPMSMLDLFITRSGNNNSQYENPEYDALITRAKAEADPGKRFELMHQAEDMLRDDYVFAPIMYYGDPYLIDPDLYNSGFWTSPLGYKYFMFTQGFENLSVCTGPNPDTIDPALNSAIDGATMIIHAFEGLYRLNKDGVPEPALAESVDVSDDGRTYTFHLRDGIQFSDGTPITAQTFIDSWVRAIDPTTAADYYYMFEVIAGFNEALGGESEH